METGVSRNCTCVSQGWSRAEKGDKLTNPDLARTLEAVAEGGHTAFYEGPIAETIANHIQELGGCITVDDLKSYRPLLHNLMKSSITIIRSIHHLSALVD